MLYHLLFALRGELSLLNVTRYITFRTAVASLTALLLVLVLGPWMIERLRRLQIGQYIREEGPQAHKAKAGTPTMGGVLILVGILVPTLLWADLTSTKIWIVVLATVAFGAVGFADDYLKVVKKRSLGLTARRKLFWQFAIGFAVGLSVYFLAQVEPKEYSTRVVFPFASTGSPSGRRSSPPPPSPASPTSPATSASPSTSTSSTSRGRGRSRSSAGRWSGRRWGSSGGTATRPRCSWATWAASPSGAPSAPWPS